MVLDKMHPEDVKAALRKQYGSVRRFVTAHGLPSTGVSDLLRGRTSQRVQDAVEKAVTESINVDRSNKARRKGGRS